MYPCIGFGFGLWWIFPVIMIVMFVFCFFMMRKHGMSCWMGCCGARDKDGRHEDADQSSR